MCASEGTKGCYTVYLQTWKNSGKSYKPGHSLKEKF